MSPNKKIILVGGSTAGHILPLFAVKDELEKKGSYRFIYFGSGSEIEKRLVAEQNLQVKKIICGKFRRSTNLLDVFKNIIDLFKIIIGFCQSLILILLEKPHLVFSKSGFVAPPVALAAKMAGVPFVIHESDTTAGLATRLCAASSHAVLTAFPASLYSKAIRKKAIHAGLPIRSQFLNTEGLAEDYILITGGSLGAREINERFRAVIPKLLAKHQIVHITGQNQEKESLDLKKTLESSLARKYQVLSFSDDMPRLMKKAKLIISRAGASAIFEIAAIDKKAIFIPISSGVAAHQLDNATFLEELKMAKVIKPQDSDEKIINKIEEALKNGFSGKISNLHFLNSAGYIASLLENFLAFFELKKMNKVFLIGALGVSMRGIGKILEKLGIKVSGSDLKTGGHSKTNINLGYDLIVYSSAADEKSAASVEHRRASQLKIPIIKRSKLVGVLMGGYRGISIAGMHGKTTVSSLTAAMLSFGGQDPSWLIGMPQSAKSDNAHLGHGIDFVSEACEYDGSFLDFKTKIAVITNIEEEHLDYFKGGLAQIIEEFGSFVSSIAPGGAIIYSGEDESVQKVIKNQQKYLTENKIEQISYGFSSQNKIKVSGYHVEKGRSVFKINSLELSSDRVGEFFALDSAAAYSVSKFIGLEDSAILLAIENYVGAARRTEFLGQRKGVSVFDDYGHHPTEVYQTLKALEEKYPTRRKIVIFQPHQQKRFNDFFEQFAQVLENAPVDVIGILPVYQVPGRDEKAVRNISDLIKKINSPKIIPLDDYEMAVNFLEENAKSSDVIMTMGATDVYKIAKKFLNN